MKNKKLIATFWIIILIVIISWIWYFLYEKDKAEKEIQIRQNELDAKNKVIQDKEDAIVQQIIDSYEWYIKKWREKSLDIQSVEMKKKFYVYAEWKYWKTWNELQKIIMKYDSDKKEEIENKNSKLPSRMVYKWKIYLTQWKYWLAKELFYKTSKEDFSWQKESEMLLHLAKLHLWETNEIPEFDWITKYQESFYYLEVAKIFFNKWDIKIADKYADLSWKALNTSIEALVLKAKIYYKKENFVMVSKILSILENKAKNNTDYLVLKASIHLKDRKFVEAEESINRILELSPKHVEGQKLLEKLIILKSSK